jgi:antitoxin ParD1/3/4
MASGAGRAYLADEPQRSDQGAMDETRKRTVELPPEIDESIDAAVAAGEYADADAAVSEALRDWKERRENWGYTIAELRAEIRKGDESGLAEDFSMDDVKAEGRRRLAAVTKSE